MSSPSLKFEGRPAKSCQKCKGVWHWVNQMGGISCCKCNPAPSTLADIDSRLLVIENNVWSVPHFDTSVIDSKSDESVMSDLSALREQFDHVSRIAAFYESVAGTPEANARGFTREWTPEETQLVNWWIDITSPENITSTASRLDRKRLSPYCFVTDSRLMINHLRSSCLAGPDSPRNCYGALIGDLRELRLLLGSEASQVDADVSFDLEIDFEIDLAGVL